MDNSPIDNSGVSSNNTNNNVDTNGAIVIRLDEIPPLNDPNCEHKLELDGEVIGNSRAWICIKCHRGVFLPKEVTKII